MIQNCAIHEELTDIFREVLNDETIVLNRGVRPTELPQWDSLSHITIAVAVEGRFGIKFRTSELEGLTSIGDFEDLIHHKRNEAGFQHLMASAGTGDIATSVREFIVGNFLSNSKSVQDSERLLDSVIDSNGVLELIAFLEDRFGISVTDGELVPENLECVEKIVAYVKRKIEAGDSISAATATHHNL